MNLRHLKASAVAAAVAGAMLFSAHGVSAATRTWLLDGVAMSGGTSLDGTFSTDSATGGLTAWNIEIAGGPDNGYLFSSSIANFVVNNGPESYEIANSGGNFIFWIVGQSLASSVTQSNVGSAGFDCPACGNTFIGTNTGSVVALPEPSVWLTMLLGMGAVGAVIRSTRRGQAALATADAAAS